MADRKLRDIPASVFGRLKNLWRYDLDFRQAEPVGGTVMAMTEPCGLNRETFLGWARYPAHRDSGVEWLGEIPAHWEVKRLKECANAWLSNVDKKSVVGEPEVRLCNYMDVYYHDRIHGEMDFMTATAAPAQAHKFSLREGDVLITKDSETWTDIAVPALVTEDLADVVCGYHLALIRPEGNCVGGFVGWAIGAVGLREQYQVAANGITRFGLTADAIKNSVLPLPPLSEQKAVTRFLDRETAKVEALVAKQQELIDVLQEKRSTLIGRAVTKGLSPDPAMKDSDVEWLGEIPAHWEVVALRYRYQQSLGKMLDTKRITGSHLVPYLRNVDVQWDHINISDLPSMDIRPHELERFTVRRGDLLVCEGGEAGRCATWHGELDPCGYQKALHRLRPLDRVRDAPRFLYYTLLAAVTRGAFASGQGSTTIEHLTGDMLRVHRFPFPPSSEQHAIAHYLDHATASIDALIARTNDAILLLQEYRTALISAAVTGRIDTRHHDNDLSIMQANSGHRPHPRKIELSPVLPREHHFADTAQGLPFRGAAEEAS